MNWFRMYSEARNDAKLRTLTDAQFRVWFNLLCLASDEEERGTITIDDLDILAIEVANGDADLLADTVARLVKLRIIAEDVTPCNALQTLPDVTRTRLVFIHFADRQYVKPSDRPERVAERVARYRERHGPSFISESDVTPGNALQGVTVTPRTDTEQIQNRTETTTTRAASVLLPLTLTTFRDVLKRAPTPKEAQRIRLEFENHDPPYPQSALRWALTHGKENADLPAGVVGYALAALPNAPKESAGGSTDERRPSPIPEYVQRAINEDRDLPSLEELAKPFALARQRARRDAARATPQR